jgi:hypothetical protein
MRSVPLQDGAVSIAGALDIHRTEAGIVPRRLPAWTRPQVPDAFMDMMVTMPSGVRLELRTDSEAIELDVMITRFRLSGGRTRQSTFDLVIDGEAPITRATSEGNVLVVDLADRSNPRFEPGGPATIRFDGLGTGMKACELWLPHNATVELRDLRVDDAATVGALVRRRARWVHHGSSISHCSEAEQPTGTWPAVAARLSDVELVNLGLGGNCHLDQFVARTMRDIPADFLSIKVGINVVNMDSLKERTFVPALHGFLDTLREGRPHTPILVVSPIICPSAEDHPGPTVPDGAGRYTTVSIEPEIRTGSLTLRRMREVIATVVEARRALGDGNLHHLDGLELFGAEDLGDMPDELHPNPAGYQRMGERFFTRVFANGGPFDPNR